MTACAPTTQYRYLTTKYRSADYECMLSPKGQLPSTASSEVVSNRIAGISEAELDCRTQLWKQGEKAKMREELVAEINAARGEEKPKD